MITYMKDGGALLRPDHGYAHIEVEGQLVRDAITQLQRKAHLVAVGIDDFTAPEKLAYFLLRDAGAFDDA